MATIRDIAQQTKLSISTISRVLSNDPSFNVSMETRDTIYQAVDKLNYKYKSKGKRNKTRSIGCIMSLSYDYYSDPFFASILNSIQANAIRYNCDSVVTLKYNDVVSKNIFISTVLDQLDGIILMEKLPTDILEYVKSKVTYLVGIDMKIAGYPAVGYSLLDSNMKVMNHLVEDCGYRHIAYVGGGIPNERIYDSTRMIAYRECLRRNDIEFDESLIIDCEWNIDVCASMTRKLLTSHPEIDAIFAGSDTLANAILGTLYDMQISCPENLGIIGFNNNKGSALSVPPLTTLEVPTQDIGIHALKILMDCINTQQIHESFTQLPTKIIPRLTTRNIKDDK